MNIYIARHGQTDWNLEGRPAGAKDIPINEKGIEQANIIKEELKSIKFDKVYSSPLIRAYETAKIIHRGKIIKDDRLRERSNGDFDGMLKTEIKEQIDINDPEEKRFNIEGINDFRKRVNSFFDEITKDKKSKNVLVVTHAGVGIFARCYFEGEPLNNDYGLYKINNCEILNYQLNTSNELLLNINKVQTTKMGINRIKKNLYIDEDEVGYCKSIITNKKCNITRKGKNFYCELDNIRITVNANNYCIITAHII